MPRVRPGMIQRLEQFVMNTLGDFGLQQAIAQIILGEWGTMHYLHAVAVKSIRLLERIQKHQNGYFFHQIHVLVKRQPSRRPWLVNR